MVLLGLVQHVGQEVLDLLLPPGPVVVNVVAPVVAPGVHAQRAEGVVHDVLGAQAFLLPGALAAAQNDLAPVVKVDVGVVVRSIGQEVNGGVEVQGGVHPVAKEELRVVAAGERDDALEEVRAAQEGDKGVRGAKRAAHRKRTQVRAIALVHEGNDLLAHVVVERLDYLDAQNVVATAVGPALSIDGVEDKELDLAALDVVLHGVDHAELLVAVAHRVLDRKCDDGPSGLTIDADAHVLAEVLAMCGYRFPIHLTAPLI